MSLFERDAFDAYVGAFAGVTVVDQWESHVAKVGDKVFALLHRSENGANICLKCPEESFEILTALEGIGQAPYFAKRKWVSITDRSPLTADELDHYLRRSYALVASGLTGKKRTELGIILPG